jgi:tetratricopeptide (TPR) repeat protein
MHMMTKFKLLFAITICITILGCESDEERRDRFFQLGNYAIEDGEYDKAIDLFNESLKIDPKYSMALNNRGVAKMEDDHPYEAILDYNQAILLRADYLDALFNRAYAYESIGNFYKSLGDIDRIMNLKPDSAFVHFYKGLVLTKSRSYDAALESFNLADSLDINNPETIINIATIHYLKDDMEMASKYVSASFELNSNDPNASNLLSLIQLKNNNLLAALVEINRAIDEVPEEPYFLNNRGFVYLQMDSLDLALDDINQSILINPKNGWAYRNKGIYFLEKDDYEQAIRLLKRAVEEPDFIDEVYVYLGQAFQKAGDIEKACEAWAKGSEKNEEASKRLLNQNCEDSFTKIN